ncbi:MAG TPA: cupin domain-containing protein [Candidatus Omnitrophota bacterium]|nr:cupin domain-containing protein [Candidatus Omnitrophota bacterium]
MPKVKIHNVFSGLPDARGREVFQTLRKGRGLRIERIVSRGQATPPGQWLCSKAAEWVIVLKGRARLLFKGVPKQFDLKAGEHVFIPRKTSHRVDWTHPKQRTVWLAVHWAEG